MGKFICLDFEFYNSHNADLEVVSVSALCDGETITEWLHKDTAAKSRFAEWLISRKETHTIVCYNAIAEARAFESIGLDSFDFTWYDLYAEWKLLQNRNDKYLYGRYFDKDGNLRRSDPGKIVGQARVNQEDKYIIGSGLADCIAHQLGIDLGKVYKGDTIDLILSRQRGGKSEGVDFNDEERQRILEYNESDITYLESLKDCLIKAVADFHEDTEEVILKNASERAYFMCAMAKSEKLGMPIHEPYLKNISENYVKICNEAIQDMNSVFPVYIRQVSASLKKGMKKRAEAAIIRSGLYDDWPRTGTGALSLSGPNLGRYYDKLRSIDNDIFDKVFVGDYKLKYAEIEKLINSLDAPNWPLTESGKYSTDDKVLGDYRHHPEIDQLRRTKRTIQQVNWFRPEAVKAFRNKTGEDGRIRFFFNPFGSQTGRNQPPAKYFVLAMSSWLRCLMKPEPGYEITTIDYASQEFAIAAAMSRDINMINAYKSGDPYLYFAKLAGAVPQDGTKEEYKTERDTFKAVVLGLQFGLGVVNLSSSLSKTLGRNVDVEETSELINKHKRAFSTYWQWKDSRLDLYYQHKIPMILGHNVSELYMDGRDAGDMWTLGPDNPRPLSVANFPVQGTGASIMRSAVIEAWQRGIQVLAPLHDAIYFIHRAEDREETIRIASECMGNAVSKFMDLDIRLDIETYTHEDDYVPAKGRKDFEKFSKYIKGV